MSARMVRIKKEMRALFGPWCAVVIAGALPVIMPHSYTAVGVMPAGLAESLSFLSFFFGVPLLATLSLGDEFRYGTLSLWLAQPSSRLQLLGREDERDVPRGPVRRIGFRGRHVFLHLAAHAPCI